MSPTRLSPLPGLTLSASSASVCLDTDQTLIRYIITCFAYLVPSDWSANTPGNSLSANSPKCRRMYPNLDSNSPNSLCRTISAIENGAVQGLALGQT